MELCSKIKIGKNIWIILVSLVAVISISPYIILAGLEKGYWWDEAVYLGLAKNMVAGEGYSINGGDESFRPPLFPYLLSAFYPNESLMKIVSPIFGIASVAAVFFLAKEIYDKKTALISSMLLASSQIYIYFGQKILTETVFATLFTLLMLFVYLAFEKNKKMFLIPAAAIFALSVMTKYTAVIIFPAIALYLAYKILMKGEKKNVMKTIFSKEFAISIFAFLIVLSPWMYFNYAKHGDMLWSMKEEVSRVGPEFYSGPWNTYLSSWTELFGVSALFAIPLALYLKKKDSFVIATAIVILVFFSFAIERKELRYIVAFLPVYYVAFAAGFSRLAERFKINFYPAFFVVLVISIASLGGGINRVIAEAGSGSQMMEAAKYVKENSATGSKIIAENYPVINYISGRIAVPFPKTEDGFENLISRENISFAIVDNFEPTTPDYADELKYPTEKIFQKGGSRVTVYRVA